MPTLELIQSNKLVFKSYPPVSLPPMTPEEIKLKKVYELDRISRVEYDSIAQAAQLPE